MIVFTIRRLLFVNYIETSGFLNTSCCVSCDQNPTTASEVTVEGLAMEGAQTYEIHYGTLFHH